MPQSLTHFAIAPDGDGYSLEFTLEDGSVIAIGASFEQLDMLAEEIDRRLDLDEG